MSDITIAASARAFDELFAELVENVKINESDTETWGPFSANYDLAIHLQGGSLTLNAGTFTVEDLDIVFDDLEVGVCFSLPQWCFGGWCIIPTPFGCIRFPHICIGGESICPSINLDGLVTQIVNFTAGLATNYWVNPARLASWSDLEAEINNKPNYWQLIVEPTLVDIDPLDVAATAADLFESAVKSAIESLISYLPNWVIDIIWTLIGPIVDLIVGVLGIVGDIGDWIQNLLNGAGYFKVLEVLETAIADYFASQNPIDAFEDPAPVLAAHNGLLPVAIPIRNLAVVIDPQEVIVTADVGVSS